MFKQGKHDRIEGLSLARALGWTLCLSVTVYGNAWAIAACDGPGVNLALTASVPAIPETGGVTAQFVFSLAEALGGNAPLTLAISGTATNGVDYVTLPTSITIPAGQTEAHLTLTPKSDVDTGDETVTVTITASTNPCVNVLFPQFATISIFEGALPAALVTSVASRKVHGGAGTFDLLLNHPPTDPIVEPRGGPGHTIVFTFDKAVTGGVAQATEGTAVVGPPTFSGNEMRVPLTGVSNQQYVTLSLSNVNGADGSTGGSGSIRFGILLGDVNQNRGVSLSDLGQVNAQVAQAVTAVNYLKDVNATGTLSLADKGITNTQVTKALPAP